MAQNIIANKQYWLQEKDEKFKIIITNDAGYRVESMLPDDFGMSVGSEFSAPFDANFLSDTGQKIFAVTGIAQKQGLRTKKLYTNPEPTEISFEMEFNAYYSAIDEVLLPVAQLCAMTLGSVIDWEDVDENIEKVRKFVVDSAEWIKEKTGFADPDAESPTEEQDSGRIDTSSVEGAGSKLLELIEIITSPRLVEVKFGKVMRWKNMYITSISPRFSNVLDANGYPMSAKVAVTVTPEKYPVADEMLRVFGLGG